jgi:hypothetical protein
MPSYSACSDPVQQQTGGHHTGKNALQNIGQLQTRSKGKKDQSSTSG